MNSTLIAIGEALIDFIPDKSGCGFSEVTAFSPKVGGAPANVCGAYSKLGGRSRMLTMLGDDPFGHKIAEELAAVGIDTAGIHFTDKANTALAFVSLGADGDRTFSFYRKPSADMLYSEDMLSDSDFDDIYALHFCSVSLGDFPMKGAHRRAIETAQRRGGMISFDPNLRRRLWNDDAALKAAVKEFIPCADILKVSEDELSFITDKYDIEDALEGFFDSGVKLVLFTLGGKGAYAFTRGVKCFSPAHKVTVVDTTGAGDGFTGSFLWKLRESGVTREGLAETGEDVLKECLDFANKFCAYSVGKPGAIASYPTAEEL